MPFSQHPQHNPGRGLVTRVKNPTGQLFNADTGEEIKHWIWADLDAGEYIAKVVDANGVEVIDPASYGHAVLTERKRAPLEFKPEPSVSVNPTLIIEEDHHGDNSHE